MAGEAARLTGQAAKEVGKVAGPALKQVAGAASDALSGAGVDIAPVAGAAGKTAGVVAGVAKPVLGGALGAAASAAAANPVAATEVALLAAVLALLSPAWAPAAGRLARGYAGDVSALKALDLLMSKEALLVDVRGPAEVVSGGTALLPSGKSNLLACPLDVTASAKLRARLPNAAALEAKTTARIIAAFKAVRGKGQQIIVMDGNGGGLASSVARSLGELGFSNAYVLKGGFQGRGGWKDSGLGVDSTPPPVAGALPGGR